jgi:hypothetical protein
VASLLKDAKPLATQCFTQLAYGTRRFLAAERWGLVGEAAAFPDPFYSPGADFIALGNDFLADLIGRDFAGESRRSLEERTGAYDEFMKFRFDAAMRLYLDNYPFFGSYELCKLKWDFDVACYYNLWISQYLHDQHLDLREVRRQVRQRKYVLSALSNFTDLFRKVDAHLTRGGLYHRKNRGSYSNGQDLLGFIDTVAAPRTHKEVLRQTEEIFNAVRNRALDLVDRGEPVRPRTPMPLSWFMAPRDLLSG